MRIMSYNTFFCTNCLSMKRDFNIIAQAIRSCQPDIVGLNEMYEKSDMDEFDKQTQKLSVLTGMKNHTFAEACTLEEGTFGNALLSLNEFYDVSVIPIPEEEIKTGTQLYEPRCLLKVKYKNGLTVLVTHFGLNPDEHINAVKTVLEHTENEKCIFMGDLNVTPDNTVLNPIREKLNDVSALVNDRTLTFPSTGPTKKIDYIFTSKDIEVLSVNVPDIIASDHKPIFADIVF